MICLTIDKGSNNTVGESCYSAHQAGSRFEEHLIVWPYSCVHCKCQTRAGLSGDINKSFEGVTITDTKFSKRVLMCVTPKSTWINWVTVWLERFDFSLHWCKWELPDQHIANCILTPELFFNIFNDSTVCSRDMSYEAKYVQKAKFPFPSLTVIEYRPCDCFGRTSIHTVFVVLYTMSWGLAHARHTSN